MLIKEYRICMPLTVEEYRIAQLYMIQKKSKVESTGQGSGVEIIRNEPYDNGPGGSGQYTFKIYHIGSHLPAWFRNILPKSALIVEEEAWNAYPYTKTRYKVPIIDKFTLEIETYYFNDGGEQENVFQLNDEELKLRIIDYLDIVNDPISSGDYRKEEDPKLYISSKTNRGPLNENWISEHKSAQFENNNCEKRIMCAYKLCRVEFKYWGMQTKIEKFIDDIGLRKTMLRAHRQAWCWQDEWYGLSIADIRQLEEEAAKELAEKMHKLETQESIELTSYLNQQPSASSFDVSVKENPFIMKAVNDPVKQSNVNNSVTQMKSIQNNSFSDEDDESFYDAKSDFPSETDSFMTCRNNFSSNLTLNMDNSTNTLSTQKSVLILVVHGGSLLDTNHEYHNKNGDISILRQTFDTVIKSSYSHLNQQIAMRLVACPSVVSDLLSILNKLTPQIIDQQYLPSSPSLQYYVPLAAIPLFVTESSNYKKIIEVVQNSLNDRYSEFMRSEEGQHFDGHISIIADAIGSIFVYDILTKCQNDSRPSLTSSSNSQKESIEIKSMNFDSSHRESDPISLKSEQCSTSDVYSALKFKLDFKVHQFFMLGSPVGLVQLFRNQTIKSDGWTGAVKDLTSETIKNMSNNDLNELNFRPNCRQLYNLFHLNDPSSYRIEPLINQRFHAVPPMKISNYNRFPHGNDDSTYLVETLFNNPGVVENSVVFLPDETTFTEHDSNLSAFLKCDEVKRVINSWWGEKRIDYGLHCPDGVQAFPLGALPHLLHASYWESKDCAAFILRQIIDASMQNQDFANEIAAEIESVHGHSFSEPFIIDKNDKIKSKQSSLKFKAMCVPYRINMTANHRANDVMVLSGQPQILSARFMYGTFDMLTPKNQKVDVYIMNLPISYGHWEKEGNEVTDNSGRVTFHIAESRRMPEGIYPIRMVLNADSSVVQFHLAVLPLNVEAIVFSIDGSFAASVSISGKDPKVRPGSIDVARFWQDKGYLLIYISARPNMQQRHVQRWLAQHKFPFGMILFSDGVSAEPLKQKLQILAKLIKEVQIKIHCAYGSSKDISIYRSLGLHSHQIFTLGRLPRHKRSNSFPLKDGYAAHLNDLLRKDNLLSKPSRCISNVTLRRSCFDIPIKYISSNKNVDNNSEHSYLG